MAYPPIILSMGLTKEESMTENYCRCNCYLGSALYNTWDHYPDE